jgi:hypothetical protein
MSKLLLSNFYLFVVVFVSLKSYAQSQADDKALIVTVSPLALADIYDGASFRLGAEAKLNQKVGLALEGGTYLKYLKATKINPEGFLIRPSVKYYFSRKSPGKFVALEYMYKDQKFDFRDSIALNNNRFEKEYGIKRIVHSVVVKYGKLMNLGKNFVFEWYLGVGVRYMRSHSTLTAEEEDGILSGEEGSCPIQEDIIRLTGTRIFPDFRGGVKIGYRFGLKNKS